MNRAIVFSVAFTFLLLACSPARKETKAIGYEMKKFQVESMKGCSSDTLPCAHYTVEYPEFSGLDTAVVTSLRNRINFYLSGGVEGEVKPIETLGNDFISEYQNFKKESPDYSNGWSFEAVISVLTLTDSLISLQMDEYSFAGGAHPNSNITFINFRPATGATVTLDDIFKEGSLDALTRIGEEVFRKEHDLADTTSLEASGFWFENDVFVLNDNYGFTPEGIIFYFNSYEVAPYAMGPTKVFIPTERLREWLK
ncbi:MAG: DUF3298 and DUF4163 domain-containing protein [Cyclobacteriaceae bacterium]|nr:DUF3298 and DUF4163 domain-containing protein [Cyclobacteriaceae bacterium]